MRSLKIEAYARLKPIQPNTNSIVHQTQQTNQGELFEVYSSK